MKKTKLKNRIRLMTLMVMALMVMALAGCGKKPVTPGQQPGSAANEESSIVFSIPVGTDSGEGSDGASQAATVDLSSFMQSSEDASVGSETTTEGASMAEGTSTAAAASTAQAEPLLDEDGTYTTKDDVALYIHTYGKLPSNFMTKKQAKKLGWSGGSLEDFAPGMCIGGDYFGNYEGLLPEDKEYHECDIDTLGKKSRGAKRIIYSDDGYIYYTEDHYESFELLYEP